MSDTPGNRNVTIRGDATGAAITTGDHNVVKTSTRQLSLPAPQSVDIQAELTAIRTLLAELSSPDAKKIDRAMADAEEEAARPEPERDEVGDALERAVRYASKTERFVQILDRLRPHVEKAAGWLGAHGPQMARVLTGLGV